ncbi:MAG TPA: L,D-transpeptidase family protein [Pedobacter sp.]|uniref:L,D-transpeptidase family protein n=1 Tax=Pedobacter sp. TaxID=1411316 RepID=UPI002C9EC2D3|nr:L,D-transpeptidase family protein [Pedobacter sp.]HMI04217.1 L,D-transpeptidase family protein [Pedobacter sp.]
MVNVKCRLRCALLLAFAIVFTFQSCRKSKSEIGKELFKETKNKVFKKIENDAFASVFKQVLADKKSGLGNPKLIAAFYEGNDYDPVLLMQHLPKKGLKVLESHLNKAGAHGLSPEMFGADQFARLIGEIYDKKAIKTVEEAYQIIAELELATANSLIGYSNALQYGIVSPRKIYAQYYTRTKRPDSAGVMSVFAVKDLKVYLDSIQPKSKSYLTLQKALAEGLTAPGMSKEETARVLEVNMERLRWKNRNSDKKLVLVNIPDYRLDVIENGKSVMNMKVCVGEGRKIKATDQLKEYDEDDLKKDRPFNRETPQLGSMIHSVQVNPVWNIPESIATKEITKYAAADRYYLANNNIDVYLDGKLIEDPETIDWSAAGAGKVYTFRQRSGNDNSLGKIKFLFDNESSVYLHDTPAKEAFKLPVRAVSHGCVRVEKPLELARVLFGEGDKFELIKKEMAQTAAQTARDIALPDKVAVYLTYFTCWADENGVLQFRKDIYGQDIVLYSYLERIKSS